MWIDLNTLPEDGEQFEGQEDLARLGLEGDAELRPLEGLRYAVFAMVPEGDDALLVTGRLALKLELCCARCGEFYETELVEPHYQWVGKPENGEACADLTEDMRETMILRFPTFPLCAETCKGLCEQCGENLNKEGCNCAPPAELNRWSVLDQLGDLDETRGKHVKE